MSNSRRQAISASYLSHDGDKLTFVSRFRPRQQNLSLTLNVGDSDLRLEVQLQQARETHKGDFICHALITEGGDQLSFPQVPQGVERYARNFPRTHARLRALSPSLPNFRALSIDVSQGGLKLEAEDYLTPGSRIEMSLDLDIPEQEPIPLNCRVVWCQAFGKTYQVGLEFIELEPWISPLLESFQAWLEGTGLRPRPYRRPPELEFPEPETDEEEPVPPAGSISSVSFAQAQVELVLAWARGEIFRVVFEDVLIFRDDRGLEGAAFHDALDLEESRLITEAMKVMPVSLDEKREIYHYQFLNRHNRPILEVICGQIADYQLIGE
jgi:PilZ domain-containing protein